MLYTGYWYVYRIIVFIYIEMNPIVYCRPFRHGGKRTLYLVDTVALVAQQASYIRHLTDLSVGEYTSADDKVDMFDMEDWEQQFQGNQVDVTSFCILWQQGVHCMASGVHFMASGGTFCILLVQCKNKHG